jgi:hypothetical protein
MIGKGLNCLRELSLKLAPFEPEENQTMLRNTSGREDAFKFPVKQNDDNLRADG